LNERLGASESKGNEAPELGTQLALRGLAKNRSLRLDVQFEGEANGRTFRPFIRVEGPSFNDARETQSESRPTKLFRLDGNASSVAIVRHRPLHEDDSMKARMQQTLISDAFGELISPGTNCIENTCLGPNTRGVRDWVRLIIGGTRSRGGGLI